MSLVFIRGYLLRFWGDDTSRPDNEATPAREDGDHWEEANPQALSRTDTSSSHTYRLSHTDHWGLMFQLGTWSFVCSEPRVQHWSPIGHGADSDFDSAVDTTFPGGQLGNSQAHTGMIVMKVFWSAVAGSVPSMKGNGIEFQAD